MPTKEPLTSENIEFLEDIIAQQKRELPAQIIGMIALFMVFIFLPGRRQNPSLYSQYGFTIPAIVIIIAVAAYNCVSFYIENRNIQKDIADNHKFVAHYPICKKEKSLLNKKYTVWLKQEKNHQSKFNIEKSQYDQLNIGDLVRIEYTQHSKEILYISLDTSAAT